MTLAAVEGLRLAGLPTTSIPIDEHSGVAGVEDIYAAGDGTNFPVKQGGIATQQADAAAESIAASLGLPIEPAPFGPSCAGCC